MHCVLNRICILGTLALAALAILWAAGVADVPDTSQARIPDRPLRPGEIRGPSFEEGMAIYGDTSLDHPVALSGRWRKGPSLIARMSDANLRELAAALEDALALYPEGSNHRREAVEMIGEIGAELELRGLMGDTSGR
jgi:hypothetical protein